MSSVTLYSQIPFFNSVADPIKSATDKEAFFDNVQNVSGTLTLEISDAESINMEVYGCTRIYDKDSKILKDSDKPWSKLAIFNLRTFKKTEGTIDTNGIYCIPIEGCLSIKLKIVSLTSTDGAKIVGAVK